MKQTLTSQEHFDQCLEWIPGGLMSLNRRTDPIRVFERARGAFLWDIEGRRYIDYHAAFSPHLLGHNHEEVDQAVIQSIRDGRSLFGAGAAIWESELARLIVEAAPSVEQVQVVNTGSEATYYALRLARAITGRDAVLVMQGGYNGWHNDVAFNLMDPKESLVDHKPGETHRLSPFTAGMPGIQDTLVHVVAFNDLEAARAVLESGRIAAVITEPVLQNIGVVKPLPGYLEGLRTLCDDTGTLLVIDEVKTGFRHALGGYQELSGIDADLTTFGKAIANGYPMGAIGGKRKHMRFFDHPDPAKRCLVAGTYNAHPVPSYAAIATLRHLRKHRSTFYPRLEALGKRMQEGLERIFRDKGMTATVSRLTSAFVVYFMDHEPTTWKDIADHHDSEFDRRYRNALVESGVFHFPLPTKQGSISSAHDEAIIDETLEITEATVKRL